MPDKKSKAKLSGEQRIIVCTLFASGYNPERVSQELKDRFNITISRHSLYRNYLKSKKWQKIIERIAKRIENGLAKHPLYDKTKRLDIILDAINEAMTWRLDKINYDDKGIELSRVEKRQMGTIASLIAAAKSEVEGNKPLVTISNHFTIQKLHELAGKNGHKKEKDADTIGSGLVARRSLRVIK